MKEDFRLGEWVVRPQRRLIERGDQSVHIKPKPMSVLACLAAAGGAPVSRTELFDEVWPGGEVSDETLTKCVAELRKAFDDTARDSRVIETIPKFGFRLVRPVEPLVPPTEAPDAQASSTGVAPTPQKRRTGRPTALYLIVVLVALGILLAMVLSQRWFTGTENKSLPDRQANSRNYSLAQKPGIAVLPFVNMSSDPENEYFSDGISEEILNALANSGNLPVIARTSSFQFKGDNRDITEIGRLLGVSHVLEGSVRKSGDSVRVSAQLIDAITGTHVWSSIYQREWQEIFALQDELTGNIVEQIGEVLGRPVTNSPREDSYVRSRGTSNLQAYEHYLRGMQLLASTDPKPIEQAAGYFKRAIALDADYADAWAAMGRSLYVLGLPNYGHSTIPASVYPGAITAYRKALELEPGHAFAMGWLGVALMHHQFKWSYVVQLLRRSLELNPNDAALLSVYGAHMEAMGMEGAAKIQQRAFRLNPFGMVPITIRAFNLLQDGRPLDGLTVLETSLIGNRAAYSPNKNAAFFKIVIGRLDESEAHIRMARQVAHAQDLSLDVSQWVIDALRGTREFPWAEVWRRAPQERVSYLVFLGEPVGWENSAAIVTAFDIAIEQRHPELYGAMFGPKPEQIPDAEWRRLQEAAGVTETPIDKIRARAPL